jgi:predicted Rossmann fold flavoprotein
MSVHDVIILGAGASGLFCAAEAAFRGRKVLVIDHQPQPGRKILVSGGGRCNFTNLHAGPGHYLSSNPDFVRSALSRFGAQEFLQRVQACRIPYHEKKEGQLFCDGSAREILQMLLATAESKGVNLECGFGVLGVDRDAEGFVVSGPGGCRRASKLVVATGGLSWPALGATDLGLRIARQFGLAVVEPAPALVGLAFPGGEKERFEGLAGIHLRVGFVCGKHEWHDDIMITHKGLSGPVVLNASLAWEPGLEVAVNWAPERDEPQTLDLLKRDRVGGGRGQVRDWLMRRIPKRLVDRIAWHAGARGAWTSLPDDTLESISRSFHSYRFIPSGTFGYKEAEVTRGGVDTHELSSKTMEAIKVPGLYFVGEVMDVTGQLGGFNLQWAWSSGWAAGQVV